MLQPRDAKKQVDYSGSGRSRLSIDICSPRLDVLALENWTEATREAFYLAQMTTDYPHTITIQCVEGVRTAQSPHMRLLSFVDSPQAEIPSPWVNLWPVTFIDFPSKPGMSFSPIHESLCAPYRTD